MNCKQEQTKFSELNPWGCCSCRWRCWQQCRWSIYTYLYVCMYVCIY